MNIKKISELFKTISALNSEEYKEFRAGFIRLDKQMQARGLDEFRIGDIVQFQSARRKHAGRGVITIQITGKGSKRLQGVEFNVKTKKPGFLTWKVPAGLCTKVELDEVTS